MTRVSERIGLLNPWWLGCLALGCVATGLLVGIDPLYGLLAAGGVTFAAVVITDLAVGFALFTALSFLDVLSTTGSFSGTKIIGLLLFMSWLARISTRQRADASSFVAENPWLVVALVAMLGWCGLSFAWAASPSVALNGTFRYALDMLLLPIAFVALRQRKQVIWVLGAFVVGAMFSVIYGLAHPTSAADAAAGRLTGTLGDANAEATVIAASIALLIAMSGVAQRSARMKLIILLGAIMLFAGLVATLSREGLLALGVVMVGGVVFGGRWRARASALLLIGVVATCGYFFVLAPLAARQRVTMSSTSGRSSIWAVAWRVVKAHPLLGVGNDNFILVEGQYINQPGAVPSALYVIVTPKVAHNTYLEALTDLGIPGLLTLLAVLGCAIAAAVRAAWAFERKGDREMEWVSRAVVLAVLAMLTSDFFVSSAYAKYLWILLAVCPVLLALARRADPGPAPDADRPGQPLRRASAA